MQKVGGRGQKEWLVKHAWTLRKGRHVRQATCEVGLTWMVGSGEYGISKRWVEHVQHVQEETK